MKKLKNLTTPKKKGILLCIIGAVLIIAVGKSAWGMFRGTGISLYDIFVFAFYGMIGVAQIMAGRDLFKGRELHYQFSVVISFTVGFNVVVIWLFLNISLISIWVIAALVLAWMYYMYEFGNWR